jgi:hypothetical protein
MANDTFAGIAGKVLLRCPTAPLTLARDWVQSAFRDVVARRRWSWLLKRGQLVTYDAYTTGTATVVAGTQTVTITTGVVSADFVGRQFRIGTALPIVTITAVDTGANTLTIDQPWYPSTQTNQNYAIYQAYVALPSDFQSFVSVIDPAYAQPIPYDLGVEKLDSMDPQRAAAGSPPRALSYFDYFNGLPRYELWPHQRSAAVYPMVYMSQPIDAFDPNATVPTLLPSDIILERAMMYCAMWPGPSAENPNPYFNPKLGLAAKHEAEYEKRLSVIEKQDTEHMQQSIWYQSDQRNSGRIISAAWMQSHAL